MHASAVNLVIIDRMITEFHQKTISAIVAAVITTVGIALCYVIWQWHSDWQIAHQPLAVQEDQSDREAEILVASLPDTHLFGKSLTAGNVPISNLQFRVTGIAKVDHPTGKNVSKVYISVAGQPSKIYEIGDTLPYGVKVYDITDDTVILENDGHLEKLPLPRSSLEFKPPYDPKEHP